MSRYRVAMWTYDVAIDELECASNSQVLSEDDAGYIYDAVKDKVSALQYDVDELSRSLAETRTTVDSLQTDYDAMADYVSSVLTADEFEVYLTLLKDSVPQIKAFLMVRALGMGEGSSD